MRAQDPTDQSLEGSWICEFECAEGALHALRLLNKLGIDGQKLMLNISRATHDFLERYVKKKVLSEKLKESKSTKDSIEPLQSTYVGLVTNEDRQADKQALARLKDMLEKLKIRPPPWKTAKDADNCNMENPKDGEPDRNATKNGKKQEDELINEGKTSSEQNKAKISSHDHRMHDRRRFEFRLPGSRKRVAVPSVFTADEDENTQKVKHMRPSVPVDYSESMDQLSISEVPPAVVAK